MGLDDWKSGKTEDGLDEEEEKNVETNNYN